MCYWKARKRQRERTREREREIEKESVSCRSRGSKQRQKCDEDLLHLMDSLGWLECSTGTGTLKVRQNCEWANESCWCGFMCVSACVKTGRQRACGILFWLHTCCMYCVYCGKPTRMLIKQKLRQDEAVKCALVWLSIHWMRRLVHVFLKWEGKSGCSDTRISKDWRGTDGETVSVIEMEGCRADDDMKKRCGWRRGAESTACFTCRSGNAALDSTRLHPSVVANSHLCVRHYLQQSSPQAGQHTVQQLYSLFAVHVIFILAAH